MTDYVNNGTGKDVRDQINDELTNIEQGIQEAPVGKAGTKDVDETNIADGKLLVYSASEDKLVLGDSTGSAESALIVPIASSKARQNVIPVMSGMSQDGFVITQSSQWNEYGADRMFDGNLVSGGSCWIIWSDPRWVDIQLPTATKVVGYVITSRNDPYSVQQAPASIVVSGSNDGSNWTQLDNQQSVAWSQNNQTKTFDIANNTAYLHYKFEFTGNLPMSIAGLQLISEYGEDTLPQNPQSGLMIFDITTHKLKIFDGTAWQDVK